MEEVQEEAFFKRAPMLLCKDDLSLEDACAWGHEQARKAVAHGFATFRVEIVRTSLEKWRPHILVKPYDWEKLAGKFEIADFSKVVDDYIDKRETFMMFGGRSDDCPDIQVQRCTNKNPHSQKSCRFHHDGTKCRDVSCNWQKPETAKLHSFECRKGTSHFAYSRPMATSEVLLSPELHMENLEYMESSLACAVPEFEKWFMMKCGGDKRFRDFPVFTIALNFGTWESAQAAGYTNCHAHAHLFLCEEWRRDYPCDLLAARGKDPDKYFHSNVSQMDSFARDVEIKKIKSTIASIESDVASLKGDVASLKGDVASMKKDIAMIKDFILNLEKK